MKVNRQSSVILFHNRSRRFFNGFGTDALYTYIHCIARRRPRTREKKKGERRASERVQRDSPRWRQSKNSSRDTSAPTHGRTQCEKAPTHNDSDASEEIMGTATSENAILFCNDGSIFSVRSNEKYHNPWLPVPTRELGVRGGTWAHAASEGGRRYARFHGRQQTTWNCGSFSLKRKTRNASIQPRSRRRGGGGG